MVGIEGKNPPGISDPSKKLVQNLYKEKKERGTAVSGGKDIYFIANLSPSRSFATCAASRPGM